MRISAITRGGMTCQQHDPGSRERAHGSVAEAARHLGISRATVDRQWGQPKAR